MKSEKKTYMVSGKIVLPKESKDGKTISAKVYARLGRRTLASAEVDAKGKYSLKFIHRERVTPRKINLVIGPPINEGKLTLANTMEQPVFAEEWKETGSNLEIEKDFTLTPEFIICVLPREIKICGIVCKEISIGSTGKTRCCPVPFAKVEIFDVDPLLHKLGKPNLNKTTPILPQPEFADNVGEKVMKPNEAAVGHGGVDYVEHDFGEIIIDRIYDRIPIFSKHLLGEVYTDECGEFCLSFTWSPGCSPSVDFSPDLIFKVSQTYFDGSGLTTHTLIAEGGSNTRWDVPDFHWVKLDVAADVFATCNPDCHPLLDRRALLLGIGDQEIYTHIDQGNDPLRSCGFAYNPAEGFHKSPFGGILDIRGTFGSKVEELGERWYRISYAKITDCHSKPADDDPTAWTTLKDTLTDVQYYFDPSTGILHSQSVALGPHTLTGHTEVEFFQIRNRQDDLGNDLHWKNENIIATWRTVENTTDGWMPQIEDGLYVFKIEVFDENGSPASDVIIGDDAADYAHMFAYINNKQPIVDIKEVFNDGLLINMECGSFEHEIGDQVKFLVDAYHPDDHLRYWRMGYQVGYGSNNGVVDRLSDGTVWANPKLENFRGKDSEFIVWTDFDLDLGLTADPPTSCTTFGISIHLAACTKTIDGYDFLGSRYGHYQRVNAGLAVYHKTD